MDLTRETIQFETEEEWLAERDKDLTSTDVSALFGCSPYVTEFELYHRKSGELPDDFQDSDLTRWGRRLESAIAYGVAEDLGLVVEPYKVYRRIPEIRMGSSFDFRIIGLAENWIGYDDTYRNLFREHGPGLMEVKNVGGFAFRQSWDDSEELEAPLHIELQVQHQLEVDDVEWSVIAPLVGGNTPKPAYRLRDREVGEAIRAKVAEFWQRFFDAGQWPAPNFAEDAGAIARLYVNSNDETVDLTDNNYLATLCAEYQAAGAEEREAKNRKDSLKAEILTIIGDAGRALAAGFTISAGTVAENPGKLITEAMVGTYVGGRRAYRNMRITAKKAAAA